MSVPLPPDQRTIDTVAPDGTIDREPIPGMEICDFCCSGEIVHRFEVDPSIPIALGNGAVSNDDWAACKDCRDLVLANDLEGLVERGVQTSLKLEAHLWKRVPVHKKAGLLAGLRAHHRRVQEQFLNARRGDGSPL